MKKSIIGIACVLILCMSLASCKSLKGSTSEPASTQETSSEAVTSEENLTEEKKARQVIDKYYEYVQSNDLDSLEKIVSSSFKTDLLEALKENQQLKVLTVKPVKITYEADWNEEMGYGADKMFFSCTWPEELVAAYDSQGFTCPSFIFIVKESGEWKMDCFATGP